MSIKTRIIKSWWVVLFVLTCYFCFEQGLRKKERDFSLLQNTYDELLQKKKTLMVQQEELMLQMRSKRDLASIEFILLVSLGLVPEGQTKVVFKSIGQEHGQ